VIVGAKESFTFDKEKDMEKAIKQKLEALLTDEGKWWWFCVYGRVYSMYA
jgi:hypothetical protein